jgi:xanthine dehydrogenase molybdopterin-binding subunit B
MSMSDAISSLTTAAGLINPMIVEGQIAGGIAQGLGGALLEELVYDKEAQLLIASLLAWPSHSCTLAMSA